MLSLDIDPCISDFSRLYGVVYVSTGNVGACTDVAILPYYQFLALKPYNKIWNAIVNKLGHPQASVLKGFDSWFGHFWALFEMRYLYIIIWGYVHLHSPLTLVIFTVWKLIISYVSCYFYKSLQNHQLRLLYLSWVPPSHYMYIDYTLLTLGACTIGLRYLVCVCVCVYVFVCTTLAATYLVCMFEVRHGRVPCRLLKICTMWTSLKTFCSGDMAWFASSDDRWLGSLLMINTPTLLDTTTNDIVY